MAVAAGTCASLVRVNRLGRQGPVFAEVDDERDVGGEGSAMAGLARGHADQLTHALQALGCDWTPGEVADDTVRALMLASAVLGSAESHVLGAELDAQARGMDLEPVRSACDPIRDEVVLAASPPGVDPGTMLLMHRAGRLLGDLSRAAGPDEMAPDSETLALARDSAGLTTALLSYHYAVNRHRATSDHNPQEFLVLALDGMRALAIRLARIAGAEVTDPDARD
jgi:hypothetical protein